MYRAARLGFLEVNRESKQFRLLSSPHLLGKDYSKTIIPYWVNPWPEAIPVPIAKLAECHAGLGGLCYSAKGNFILTSESVLSMWRSNGNKLDAYILPSPSGDHSIGIHYGSEGYEYLSPHGDKEKVQALLDKYK